ncbi:hypothetical protein Sste5346_008033 [Sporothrix stenoceras]|uniref:Uncharacterized protein n=1 Tax=Sporothrix stenoceras TaxID=5173 RepID=A0ABR3YSH5_9PEZI
MPRSRWTPTYGLVGLDGPIKTHIPEIEQCQLVEKGQQDGALVVLTPARDIALRDLLTNTSGLGTSDTYGGVLGKDHDVPPHVFLEDVHV